MFEMHDEFCKVVFNLWGWFIFEVLLCFYSISELGWHFLLGLAAYTLDMASIVWYFELSILLTFWWDDFSGQLLYQACIRILRASLQPNILPPYKKIVAQMKLQTPRVHNIILDRRDPEVEYIPLASRPMHIP